MNLVVLLVATAVLVGAARVALARARAPVLPPAASNPPRVTVLLPVRDEEENVAAALVALAAQTVPLEIRVLDDGSNDSTAAIVAALAASDRRIQLFAVPPPPEGANGKVHALAWGLAGVDSDWLLAVDADARPAPEAVARALAAAGETRLDAISLAARQRVATVGEALLTPLVFGLLDAELGDWRRAARGESAPVANGQFVLVRRAALLAIGGYAALALERLDDIALARRFTAAGFRIGFWRARDLLEVRMYRGFVATFRGWRRNLALLFGGRPRLVLGAIAAALLPATVGVASLVAGSSRLAFLSWLAGAAASALLRAGTGSSALFGALYPLDAVASALCLLAARRDRARGQIAAWRGRSLELRAGDQVPSGAE